MPLIKLLFAREHWLEIAGITFVGISSLLYFIQLLPSSALLVAMLFGLYPLSKTAVIELFRNRKIGTELFITAAVIISILGGEYLAGAIVLMIILIAEYIASVSGERARASIKELIDSTPKEVVVKRDGQEYITPIDKVLIGDIVLVRMGDKVPVDGSVLIGEASVNQAPITGESMPLTKVVGDLVYAGSIVESGALDIRVDKLVKDTVLARIIALVEEAESEQAPIEKFTDKVASWLIPVSFVFVAAVYFYTRDVQLIIALLIFSSPAELGLATPLVTIAAIARAAREGILVKGGLYLEALAKVDTLVFDKTGTLTIGKPGVRTVEVVGENFSEFDVIKFAASADRRSSHPLAQAILAYAKERNVGYPEPTDFQFVNGRGVKAIVENVAVLLGNRAFMEENSISMPAISSSGPETILLLAVQGTVVGIFYIRDVVRPKAKESIEALRRSGIKNIVMLSGDNTETANFVGKELGITDVRANLLPEDKIQIIAAMLKDGARVAMVGDGINDAPALAQATVGIAMGGIGTEAAMEAADIVLMTDDLTKIERARSISKKAYRTIKENIFVGVGVVHVIGITLVLFKVIGPIEAAAIHLVPDTLVFLNSIKLLRVKISSDSEV
ncbi:MAG: cation-translocating P-type ATPase [Minisyncoccia bacterium]